MGFYKESCDIFLHAFLRGEVYVWSRDSLGPEREEQQLFTEENGMEFIVLLHM